MRTLHVACRGRVGARGLARSRSATAKPPEAPKAQDKEEIQRLFEQPGFAGIGPSGK